MGVTKFNSIFVSSHENKKQEVETTCRAYFFDLNQYIFSVINLFIFSYCEKKKKPETDETVDYVLKKSVDKPKDAFRETCSAIIDDVLASLDKYKQLKEIHLAMDGTPCHGKIQQQVKRRKNPERIYYSDGNKLFMSNAMTVVGTFVTDIFSSVITEKFNYYLSKKKREIFIEMSLCDIPGEGEHKILDMVRRCSYANFSEGSPQEIIIIDSNDSDTIISLLHQQISYTFIRTQVYNNKVPEEKIVSLSDIRDVMTKTPSDVENLPLFIAFAGNDFLPEMLDTLEIGEMFQRMKSLYQKKLTKYVKIDEHKEVKVIDFKNLEEFIKIMSDAELQMYHSKIKIDASSESNPKFRDAQFETKIPENNSEKFEFKKNYYNYVYKKYREAAYGHKQKSLINFEFPDEDCAEYIKILGNFEMEMALSYMKTYVYYYYYQSGFSVDEPLNNSYYPYGFPPLYNSLKKLFVCKEKEKYLIQFSHEYNPNLIPKERDIDYYNKLPKFTKLHHFMIFQTPELMAIYDEIPFDDRTTEQKRQRGVLKDTRFKTRFAKNPIEICPCVDITRLLEMFSGTIDTKPIVRKENTGIKVTTKRNFAEKYVVKGELCFE